MFTALIVCGLAAPRVGFAQTRGFLTVDLPVPNTFREKIVTVGLGGLHDLLDNWISVGAQADFHGIYSVRIGPFAQANVVHHTRYRRFVIELTCFAPTSDRRDGRQCRDRAVRSE